MLLKENALGGHIYHIYEDPEMSFSGIKDILVKAANGELQGTEKVDGINGVFSYSVRDGKARLYRNKSGGMTVEDIEQKYSGTDKANVGKTFTNALTAFEKFFKSMDTVSLTEIFGRDGHKLYNCEIVDSQLPNVIHYDGNKIIIHLTGHKLYKDGQYIPSKFTEEIQYLGKAITALSSQDGYSIEINKLFELKEIENKEILKEVMDQLNEEMYRSQMKDSDTIKNYLISRKNQGFSEHRAKLQPLEQIINSYAQTLLEGMVSQYVEDHDEELSRLNQIDSTRRISTTTEGFVFHYNNKLYKFTGTFSPINKAVNDKRKLAENVNPAETYMFFPGAFKPPHKGHMSLVRKYAPKVNNFVIVMSQKPRSSGNLNVEYDLAREVWDKYLEKCGLKERVKIVDTEISPILKMFDIINTQVPQGSKVYLLRSTKDGDDNRFNLNTKRDDITIKIVNAQPLGTMGSTGFREAIDASDLIEMGKYIPDDIKHKDMFSEYVIDKAKNTEEIPISINETLDILDELIISETIRKTGNKYCLYSKKSHKNLGCYDSKSGAEKRERQVQYFKHVNEEGAVANSLAAAQIPFAPVPNKIRRGKKNVRRKNS